MRKLRIKKTRTEIDYKSITNIIIKDIHIRKDSEQKRQESDEGDLDKEVDSVMIMTTPRSKGMRSRNGSGR